MRTGSTGTIKTLGAIAALGTTGALSGCTMKQTIWPADLPAVTAAAATMTPGSRIVAHDAEGTAVELSGRLDAVVVTRSDERGVRDRFNAPMVARFEDAAMTVSNRDKQQSYPRPTISSVEVRLYDRGGAIGGGIVMIVFGGIFLLSGAAVSPLGLQQHDGTEYALPIMGASLMSIGVGLEIGGIPLVVAGTRDPWKSVPRASSPASAAPALAAGPGGFKILF